MNWKLILTLSIFGLAMAIATISLIPSNIEPVFWLIIFLICAYIIAKRVERGHFWHGFLVSIVNSVWITTAHASMFDTYTANHPEMLKMGANMPMSDNPRLAMILMGPVFGVIFGLILGLFSFVAAKIMKKKPTTTAP